MFHPVPGCAQVVLQYDNNGQFSENVYWVKGTGAWTSSTLHDLCTAFNDWETDFAGAHRVASVALETTTATDYNSESGLQEKTSTFIVGTRAGNSLPNNVSLAVKFATGFSGRAKRGRTFWIGLSEGDLDGASGDQDILAATTASIRAALLKLIDGTITMPNSGQLVVAHRRHGTAFIDPATTLPVTDFVVVDRHVDSQRRRLPGHNRRR